MSRFFRAVKAGLQGARSHFGPGRFAAAGVQVRCNHCKGEVFESQEAQMNTAGMTLLKLDWMNRSGTALVCTGCGLIQWFAGAPQRIDG
jgi:uncharacterized protein